MLLVLTIVVHLCLYHSTGLSRRQRAPATPSTPHRWTRTRSATWRRISALWDSCCARETPRYAAVQCVMLFFAVLSVLKRDLFSRMMLLLVQIANTNFSCILTFVGAAQQRQQVQSETSCSVQALAQPARHLCRGDGRGLHPHPAGHAGRGRPPALSKRVPQHRDSVEACSTSDDRRIGRLYGGTTVVFWLYSSAINT
jgi:hypothetical protein